ncbi:Heavy-metal resistance [Shimia gijangensis]|uniref:Heavy-metal resistance n=1 Tax=Shimia gijangensis TaxID=1470563 RepID=A0A1M6LK61_9RHOB|nr:periplasmic heavy metal sensor [Shimia gijangensis]SHJ71584.1 Heavy-metal resistance [Shimia gijangensis]
MSDEATKKPRMRRSVRILLIVSLALNLIIIGLVLGAALSHGGKGRGPDAYSDGPQSPIALALSWEERRDVGKKIRAAHRKHASDRKVEKIRYETLISALNGDPYDPDAVSMAREALDQASWDRRQIAYDIWVTHVGKMSVEQRQDYAERLREVLNERRSRRDRGPKTD